MKAHETRRMKRVKIAKDIEEILQLKERKSEDDEKLFLLKKQYAQSLREEDCFGKDYCTEVENPKGKGY